MFVCFSHPSSGPDVFSASALLLGGVAPLTEGIPPLWTDLWLDAHHVQELGLPRAASLGSSPQGGGGDVGSSLHLSFTYQAASPPTIPCSPAPALWRFSNSTRASDIAHGCGCTINWSHILYLQTIIVHHSVIDQHLKAEPWQKNLFFVRLKCFTT